MQVSTEQAWVWTKQTNCFEKNTTEMFFKERDLEDFSFLCKYRQTVLKQKQVLTLQKIRMSGLQMYVSKSSAKGHNMPWRQTIARVKQSDNRSIFVTNSFLLAHWSLAKKEYQRQWWAEFLFVQKLLIDFLWTVLSFCPTEKRNNASLSHTSATNKTAFPTLNLGGF